MTRGPDYQKERSERQEQRILEALRTGPMTAHQLSDRLHISRQCAQVHLRTLMKQPDRRVHITSFQLSAGRPRVIYALGSGHDVKIERFQQDRILDMLNEITVPQSAYQIAERMGMGYGNAKRYMRGLKKRRKIHIAAWLWSEKTPFALYLIGYQKDMPKPTRRPNAFFSLAAKRSFVAVGAQA
jgi:predicted ArsR family transcriptional regulator